MSSTPEQLAARLDSWGERPTDLQEAKDMLRTLPADLAEARAELSESISDLAACRDALYKVFPDVEPVRLVEAVGGPSEVPAYVEAVAKSLAADLAKLQARERACDTMQQAEIIALVRMGQEMAEALGLDPLTASPAEIVAAVAQARAERDAAFAMSRCECGTDESCANLVKATARSNVLLHVMQGLLSSGVGQQMRHKLANGQGTNTTGGKAWVSAFALFAAPPTGKASDAQG